jgi:PIN domain nuclease of toxin-antitoxin system
MASLWEMGIKAANGKLDIYAEMIASGPDTLAQSLDESGFALMAIDLGHVLAAPRLPQHHRDPFDRMVIAQALAENLILISSDAIFERYAGLKLLAA